MNIRSKINICIGFFIFTWLYVAILTTLIFLVAQLVKYPEFWRSSLSIKYLYPYATSTLGLPSAIITSASLWLIVLKVQKKSKSFLSFLQKLSLITFGTNAVAIFFLIQFLINRVHFTLIDGLNLQGIIRQFVNGSPWWAVMNISICMLVGVVGAAIYHLHTKSNPENDEFLVYLSWLIPVTILLLDSLINFLNNFVGIYDMKPFQKLILGFILKSLFALCFICLSSFCDNKRIVNFVYFVTISVLILFVLIVKIPFRAFSFRPEFAELDIERGKFLVFVIAIWLCFCLIALFFQSKSQLGIRICLAGLVYIYALPTESVITPTLDNMHYTGENFGIWYNIFERNNLPYADFEVHRGILANVIPSYIANFLSPGNPELFSYSYLLIALLISTLFVLVFNKKIKFLFLLVILSLLPYPQGYVETEILCFLTLAYYYFRYRDKKIRIHDIPKSLTISCMLILLCQGVGIIITLLIGLLILYSLWNNKFLWKINNKEKILLAVYSFLAILVVMLSSRMLVGAVKWVSSVNNVNAPAYGDNWLGKYLYGESFPVNLRWLIFLFIFALVGVRIFSLGLIQKHESRFIELLLLYLALISSRWLTRSDQDSLSRVGIGFLLMLLILVLPFMIASNQQLLRVGSVVLFILSYVLSAFTQPWQPFVLQSTDRTIFSSKTANPDYVKRGLQYGSLKTVLENFKAEKFSTVNLTGGLALDFYLNLPSIGGIQTPYHVVSDQQEDKWLKKLLQEQNLVLIGPYGGLGGLAPDETTIASRAPRFFSWMVKESEIWKCKNFLISTKNFSSDHFKEKIPCSKPSNLREKHEMWVEFNSTETNLGNSFIAWGKMNSKVLPLIILNQKEAKLVTKDGNFRNGFHANCTDDVQEVEIVLRSTNGLKESYKVAFRNGFHAFDTRIFPITTLSQNEVILKLDSDRCNFAKY